MRARKADLWIRIGMELEIGYEELIIDGSRNRKIRIGMPGHLDASEKVLRLEVPKVKVTREMGDIHPQGNPHYWLDPLNARIVAAAIAKRLSHLSAGDKGSFRANLAAFVPVGVYLLAFLRPTLHTFLDREAARVLGVRVVLWELLYFFALGLAVSAASKVAGALLVFCYLVVAPSTALLLSGWSWRWRPLRRSLRQPPGSTSPSAATSPPTRPSPSPPAPCWPPRPSSAAPEGRHRGQALKYKISSCAATDAARRVRNDPPLTREGKSLFYILPDPGAYYLPAMMRLRRLLSSSSDSRPLPSMVIQPL